MDPHKICNVQNKEKNLKFSHKLNTRENSSGTIEKEVVAMVTYHHLGIYLA